MSVVARLRPPALPADLIFVREHGVLRKLDADILEDFGVLREYFELQAFRNGRYLVALLRILSLK